MGKQHKSKHRKLAPAEAREKTLVIPETDVEAGMQWLEGLGEARFRDSVLLELFRKMRQAGAVEWFENIHGRYDKGVDYLVVSQSALERTVLGIQVKGKPLSRAGGGGALSAVAIAAECEAAMQHEYQVQGAPRRLDSIAVWSSAHITPDAEEELRRPGLLHRIQLKKPREVFALIDQYAPNQLSNVPQLALVKYIKEQANPQPEAVSVLGCRLNPQNHFLEPELSEHPPGSIEGVQKKGSQLTRKPTVLSLDAVLDDRRHTILFGDDLSGKSYLLKRCKAVLSRKRTLCVPVPLDALKDHPVTPDKLVTKTLGFLGPRQAESFSKGSGIVLMIDDLHRVPQTVREWLFALDARQYRVIATARSVVSPATVLTVHITGVNLRSLPRFLRSLNIPHPNSLLDRAQAYIERTLATSCLPVNPFTISIMLQECRHAAAQFSTPTMGRLIERFVELQLGSHADYAYSVDFETKRTFLSDFAGSTQIKLTRKQLRRRLLRFIEASKHPQSVDEFVKDFEESGVFAFTDIDVKWAHPAFKQYFWVKNLLANGKHDVLARALCKNANPILAALVGSQIRAKEAPKLFEPLLKELKSVSSFSVREVVSDVQKWRGIGHSMSDEAEEKLLGQVESLDNSLPVPSEDGGGATATPTVETTIDEATKELIRQRFDEWIAELSQSKLEYAFNLASLLVNARSVKHEWKRRSLDALLGQSSAFGCMLERLIKIIFHNHKDIAPVASTMGYYAELHIFDRMLGDPFLMNVLRGMVNKSRDARERLRILDLLLCCGDNVCTHIVENLKALGRPDITLAVYARVVLLYYFRYHREIDKQILKKLLRDIRATDRSRELPGV